MSARSLARLLRHGTAEEINRTVRGFPVSSILLESYEYHEIRRLLKQYAPNNMWADHLHSQIWNMVLAESERIYASVKAALSGEDDEERAKMIHICRTAKSFKGLDSESLECLLVGNTFEMPPVRDMVNAFRGKSEVARDEMVSICETASSWRGLDRPILEEYLQLHRHLLPVYGEDSQLKEDNEEDELVTIIDTAFDEHPLPRGDLHLCSFDPLAALKWQQEEEERNDEWSVHFRGIRSSPVRRLMPEIRKALKEGRAHPYPRHKREAARRRKF